MRCVYHNCPDLLFSTLALALTSSLSRPPMEVFRGVRTLVKSLLRPLAGKVLAPFRGNDPWSPMPHPSEAPVVSKTVPHHFRSRPFGSKSFLEKPTTFSVDRFPVMAPVQFMAFSLGKRVASLCVVLAMWRPIYPSRLLHDWIVGAEQRVACLTCWGRSRSTWKKFKKRSAPCGFI